MNKRLFQIIIVIGLIALLLSFLFHFYPSFFESNRFNGNRAYKDVLIQIQFGPRVPGTVAHTQTQEWISENLANEGWSVYYQDFKYQNLPLRNIIASRGKGPLIILGAHYDSRRLADQDSDPVLALQPVAGANDGASGVAVLLELARVLPKDLNHEIRLVFFDAEDQGKLENWDWIIGSTAYATSLDEVPTAVIIIDMVGDKDLKVVKERYSSPELVDSIWQTAKRLGHGDVFVEQGSLQIIDDHIPFLNAGYPAMDIIDFTYPAWHTSQDTPDKVSAESLQTVGQVLLTWLSSH